MSSRSVYILVLGLISLAGIFSAAFAAKLDGGVAVITGVLVVAGVAAGALATLAHEESRPPEQVVHYAVSPAHAQGWGWPTPPDFHEKETTPHPTVGGE